MAETVESFPVSASLPLSLRMMMILLKLPLAKKISDLFAQSFLLPGEWNRNDPNIKLGPRSFQIDYLHLKPLNFSIFSTFPFYSFKGLNNPRNLHITG